jgi:hypothetical protein
MKLTLKLSCCAIFVHIFTVRKVNAQGCVAIKVPVVYVTWNTLCRIPVIKAGN